jgi:hypothetical protein
MNGLGWAPRTIVDLHAKTADAAIKSASTQHGGMWVAEAAPDTRRHFSHKLYKDGGSHWPDRWIVRRIDE